MRDFTAEAIALSANRTRADLDTDRMFQLALDRLLELIGEAATHVPDELRTLHPHVPWRNIVGLRNWLIHAYLDVDRDIVWSTARHDLPPLVIALNEILANRSDGAG